MALRKTLKSKLSYLQLQSKYKVRLFLKDLSFQNFIKYCLIHSGKNAYIFDVLEHLLSDALVVFLLKLNILCEKKILK